MYKKILEHFPKDNDYTTYVEPFGGSYTVGLHMPYIPPIEIWNDLEKNVFSLYSVIQNKEMFEKFALRANSIVYSEALRDEYKELLSKDNGLSVEDRAFYFFYVNRSSHNGIGGFSQNIYIRRGMAKSISDYLSAVDRLPELHSRLQHVLFLNRDYSDVMEKYSNKDCFLYCDPPYVWSTRGATRYNCEMTDDDHRKFIDLCAKSHARILVSGYESEIYNSLEESGFKKITFDVTVMDGNYNAKKATEALWKNY